MVQAAVTSQHQMELTRIFFTNYLFLLPKRLPVPESYWPYHQNYVVKGLVCQSALFREYLQ